MSKIHSFAKIFPVGSDFVPDLFKGSVQIEEKIDGSQFCFGVTKEGEVVVRSKGKEMNIDNPEKMFEKAVQYVRDNETLLKEIQAAEYPQGVFWYGEFLGSPSHNILKYSRVPKNNVILFGMLKGEGYVKDYNELNREAERIGLEVVPLLYKGEIKSFEELNKFLEVDSVLGNEKVEGVVVKNYLSPAILGNMIIPSMGKYVRDDFKERHAKDWGPKFSGSSKLQAFIDSFRTEARFHKAIQHLRDNGELENSPKDIGKLLKELERDTLDEEKENIKSFLYNHYKEEIVRKARSGFPEFYKELLAKRAFHE
ncbi:MAG: RNA ligase family protein [Nitrospiria bacterium]